MSRTSRSPVALGLAAVGLAVLGLAVVLYSTYIGVRDTYAVLRGYGDSLPGDVVDAMVTAAVLEAVLPAGLLVAGLLVCVGLVLAGRAAGRAALVWLCGVGSVVTLVLYTDRVLPARGWGAGSGTGPPAWAGVLGVLGVLVAMIALAGAAVSLGVPAARQAFAATPIDQGGVGQAGWTGAPAPLRAAVSRFAVGGVLSLAGPVFAIGYSLADIGLAGLAGAAGLSFVAVTGAIAVAATAAGAAAFTARSGRPHWAHAARIAGVLLLLLQVWFLDRAAGVTALGLRRAFLDSDHQLIGTLMLVTAVAGIAATLGGFAGLADPRSERFLRPAGRRPHPVWQPWPAADPRPADDPAPVGGYTVP